MGESRGSKFQPKGGRGRLLSLTAVLFVLTGCESPFGSRQQGDPLVGIHAPTPVTASGATSNPQAQASSGSIPPLPSSYSSTGTVPAAGGETATPDARDLRIKGDTVTPASSPTPGAARGSAPGVTVGNPEPAPPGTTANLSAPPPPVSNAIPTTAPTPPATAANIRTYEDAQSYLKQHGVSFQQLKVDEGEWTFTCSIPNPSNPHVSRTYQTHRPFPDYLSAIRAVIAEIEQTPR